MNMNIPSPAAYTTKDFNEIRLLLASNLRLLNVKRNGACYFSFDDRQKAISLTESFWRGDLKMNLRDFVSAEKLAKQLIHRNENELSHEYASATAE